MAIAAMLTLQGRNRLSDSHATCNRLPLCERPNKTTMERIACAAGIHDRYCESRAVMSTRLIRPHIALGPKGYACMQCAKRSCLIKGRKRIAG